MADPKAGLSIDTRLLADDADVAGLSPKDSAEASPAAASSPSSASKSKAKATCKVKLRRKTATPSSPDGPADREKSEEDNADGDEVAPPMTKTESVLRGETLELAACDEDAEAPRMTAKPSLRGRKVIRKGSAKKGTLTAVLDAEGNGLKDAEADSPNARSDLGVEEEPMVKMTSEGGDRTWKARASKMVKVTSRIRARTAPSGRKVDSQQKAPEEEPKVATDGVADNEDGTREVKKAAAKKVMPRKSIERRSSSQTRPRSKTVDAEASAPEAKELMSYSRTQSLSDELESPKGAKSCPLSAFSRPRATAVIIREKLKNVDDEAEDEDSEESGEIFGHTATMPARVRDLPDVSSQIAHTCPLGVFSRPVNTAAKPKAKAKHRLIIRPKKAAVAKSVNGDEGDVKQVIVAPSSKASTEACATAPAVGRDRLGIMVHRLLPIGEHCLVVAKGSIVEFAGDAIVNAANENGLSGGGVDGAVIKAAGQEVQAERLALPEIRKGVRIPTGDARATSAGKLKVKCCIHAVGPVYGAKQSKGDKWDSFDTKLQKAYRASLKLAIEHGCSTVAFALLSSGVFRGERSLDDVITLGVQTLFDSLKETTSPALEVHLVAYSTQELAALSAALRAMTPA